MTTTDDLLALICKVLIDGQIRNLTIAEEYKRKLNKIHGPDKTKRSK